MANRGYTSKPSSKGDRGGGANATVYRGAPKTRTEYNERRRQVAAGEIDAAFLCPACLKYVDLRDDGSIRSHLSSGVPCLGATPRVSGVDLTDLCEHGEFPKDRGTRCPCPKPTRKRRTS